MVVGCPVHNRASRANVGWVGGKMSRVGGRFRERTHTGLPKGRHGRIEWLRGGIVALSLLQSEYDVLDRFWDSRGVVEEEDRQKLISLGLADAQQQQQQQPVSRQWGHGEDCGTRDASLPGVSSTWDGIEESSEEYVVWVSEKVLDLHRFLGSRPDVDIVWMIQREPGILEASMRQLTERLLELRVDEASTGIDVAKLVESQPSLLLDTSSSSSSGASGGDNAGDEDSTNKRDAWEHGLLGDGAQQWASSYRKLIEYKDIHGDCHVGYRDGDPRTLARWSKKQRKDYRLGKLDEDRLDKLAAIGFEFDDDKAEWMRWYHELLLYNKREVEDSQFSLAAPKGTSGDALFSAFHPFPSPCFSGTSLRVFYNIAI